jgi:hypothetical protein
MKNLFRVMDDEFGYSTGLGVLLILSVIILVLVVYLVIGQPSKITYHNPATTASSSTSSSNAYTVLPPATVPPKTPECTQTVTYDSSGASGPVTCSNGDLNSLEWNSLSALEPSVMKLGYSATSAQVQSALCADVEQNISNQIELISYQISSLYYGWNFSSNPSAVITNGTCQNVDD